MELNLYIQTCLKGIRGETSTGAGNGLSWSGAQYLITSGQGILSRWWQTKGIISPGEVAAVLTELNLDRHLNDYAHYGATTPFISLSAGYVGRDRAKKTNAVYSAIDIALGFATHNWKHPGVVFYCWVPVSMEKAVEISTVAEPIRDTLSYRKWFQHLHQGEVTAKITVPANQISRVEWWDGSLSKTNFTYSFDNPAYVQPARVTDFREWF